MGSCTAGGAYVPAMSDVTIIVREQGTIFPRRPAAGEGRHRRGGHGRGPRRRRCAHPPFGRRRLPGRERRPCAGAGTARGGGSSTAPSRHGAMGHAEAPAYDPAELPGIVPADTAHALRHPRGDRAAGRRLRLDEFKPRFGETLVTGLRISRAARWASWPITGCSFPRARSRARISSNCAAQRGIPLVFLQNITGFMVGRRYENEGIARHGAKMVTAVATTQVPKITMVVGGSFGAGNYGMSGRAYSARASCGHGRIRGSR